MQAVVKMTNLNNTLPTSNLVLKPNCLVYVI